MIEDELTSPADDIDKDIAAHMKEIEDAENASDPSAGDPPAGDPPAGDPPAGDSPKDDKKKTDDPPKDGDKPKDDKIEEPHFNIEGLNKALSSEFKSVDEVKERLAQLNEIDALRRGEEDWKVKYKEKDDLLREYSNPLSHFKDENEYKRQQLLKKHPELNANLAGSLFSEDVDKMDNLDAIVLRILLENPGIKGGDKAALDYTYDKFGIDPEVNKSEWDSLVNTKIDIEGNQAKSFLKNIRDEIKLPETVDFEAQKKAAEEAAEAKIKKLGTDWEPFVNRMLDKFEKLSFTKEKDGKQESYFEYEVNKEYKEGVRKETLEAIVRSGLEVNDENLVSLVQDFQDQYFLDNRNKIIQAYADQEIAKKDEEWRRKTDNPKPPSEEIASDEKLTDDEKKNADVDREVEEDLDKF